MKERFKENKWALALFIATIGIIVSAIVGIILIYVMLPSIFDQARVMLREQGYTDDVIDAGIATTKGILVFSMFLAVVLDIFVALCGFKCALKGEWRKGAIVFGAIFVVDGVSTVFKNFEKLGTEYGNLAMISIPTSAISLALSVVYLIGAIKSEIKPLDVPSVNGEQLLNNETKSSYSDENDFRF